MSEGRRYLTQAALRTALEEHLRARAHDTGVPLDRLRKEVAHQRLLARLVVLAPTGAWALRGGQALSLAIPDSNTLRSTCRQTFALRKAAWPPTMPAPPATWVAVWESYVRDHDIPWSNLDAAGEALASFWRPLLVSEEGTHPAHWDVDSWAWSAAIWDVSLGLGSCVWRCHALRLSRQIALDTPLGW